MNQDHHFWIGKTHKICQDYCLSGIKGDINYCIVCDGCSSSPDTDFGARLLARSAFEFIDKSNNQELFSELVINKANTQAQSLGLSPFALDATLLTVACINDIIYINMFGDGIVYIKRNSFESMVTASYPENAPYYLNYILDKNRNNKVKEIYNNKNIFKIHNLYKTNNSNNTDTVYNISGLWYHECIYKYNIKYVALMSDGVESFEKTIKTDTSITSAPVNAIDIVNTLLDFKGTIGKFVQRRALRCIKDFQLNGIHHNDDVSVAVLYNENNS